MKRTFAVVIFACVFMFPYITEGWPGSCSVEITGPNTLCNGDTITLEACGMPSGGSCNWSSSGGVLIPSGCSATFSSPMDGEFWINVVYSSSGEFRCYDTDLITVGSRDRDNDGHYAIGSCKEPADDCNDNDPDIYPGNMEICDNKDNNCNGQVDEGLSTDADGDGHYTFDSCKTPKDDCNDNDPHIHPEALELCDYQDNNCNGKVDEGFPVGLICSAGVGACERQGIFECAADGMGVVCNALPGEPQLEICDGIDNDCDGEVDEGCEMCEDKDGDGHYAIRQTCPQGDDCNDSDATVYPGAPEVCDGKDNDCDGIGDNICPVLPVPLYKQCASLWGMDIYDRTGETICKKGCALTSAVMVLRYYGVTTGIDGKEVNPRNLNEWLIKNDGYTPFGGIVWGTVTRYSNGKISFTIINGRNDEVLNHDLCNGKPVIVEVSNHFVVATGTMCSNDETTWSINDPGRNLTTLQGYGNTYLGLRRTHAW
jgi:hypothetical protein